jgi:zinc transport system ATP-binding protein
MFALSRQRAPESGRIIEASGLTVRRGRRTILRGVDVGIGEGEILTLVGPNGAGKTTLLRTLIGLEAPAAGTLRNVPRMRVGYVPQHFSVDRNLPLPVERFLSLAGPTWKQAAQEIGIESLLARPL